MSGQSKFSWGKPHFSPDHANHSFGSRAPVQQDLQVRHPTTGKVMHSVGVPFKGQTTLPMFPGFKK